ncbi:transcriptional regulator [Methylobacterium sp. Leaf456]|uniref:helix-turn-helix domain-containing protein n=1 Tax=Methylobacterium sp. Leaf456 TaxID=1736382 RepID=UPI0006FAED23|nr:helix-turn-helix domain-containing protein [Methylobacterium sp. Leaf456]KQT53449.1 transcriptional regulator [Methylobacterium sp. Leaf456]
MTIVRTRTPSGEAIVILPEAEFERLRDLAEDTLDARAVDASEARLQAGAEELMDEADLDALRAAPSSLTFWRERRGMAASALAQAAAIEPERLAAIERGERMPDAALNVQLAKILGVDAEDLAPEPAGA